MSLLYANRISPKLRLCRSNSGCFLPKSNSPMLPNNYYEGKAVLITGGGSGLGKAMAMYYSKLGAKVMISSRRFNILEQTAKEIQQSTGNECFFCPSDVRIPSEVTLLADKTIEMMGLPDIIINNAAGNFVTPFERLSPNGFRTIVDIVLNGTANVTLEFGKRLIANKKSAVFLAITTTYASTGSGFVVASACAKAGVEAMVKSLAAEWGKYGLRFVGIAPGPIETSGANQRLDPLGVFKRDALETIPAGRLGHPSELANLATYLTSDYAAWMSGTIVTFDGGETVMNGGEFNSLRKVSPAQWDEMETLIRGSNKK